MKKETNEKAKWRLGRGERKKGWKDVKREKKVVQLDDEEDNISNRKRRKIKKEKKKRGECVQGEKNRGSQRKKKINNVMRGEKKVNWEEV